MHFHFPFRGTFYGPTGDARYLSLPWRTGGCQVSPHEHCIAGFVRRCHLWPQSAEFPCIQIVWNTVDNGSFPIGVNSYFYSRGVVFDFSPPLARVQNLPNLQDLLGATRFLQSILQLDGQQLTHWQFGKHKLVVKDTRAATSELIIS